MPSACLPGAGFRIAHKRAPMPMQPPGSTTGLLSKVFSGRRATAGGGVPFAKGRRALGADAKVRHEKNRCGLHRAFVARRLELEGAASVSGTHALTTFPFKFRSEHQRDHGSAGARPSIECAGGTPRCRDSRPLVSTTAKSATTGAVCALFRAFALDFRCARLHIESSGRRTAPPPPARHKEHRKRRAVATPAGATMAVVERDGQDRR